MKLYNSIWYILMLLVDCSIFGQSTNFTIEGVIDVNTGHVNLISKIPLDGSELNFTKTEFPAIIKNKKFTIEGSIPCPYYFQLRYFEHDSCKFSSDFFIIEPKTQTVIVNLKSATITVYNSTMEPYYKTEAFQEKQKIKRNYRWLRLYSDSLKNKYGNFIPDSLKSVIKLVTNNFYEREEHLLYSQAIELNNSYLSLWELYTAFALKGFKPEYELILLEFSDRLKGSNLGKFVKNRFSEANKIGVGKSFPKTIYKNLRTSRNEYPSIISKYTLVDIWYTGCAICIKNIPKLQKLYSSYSRKEFNIISISTDKIERLGHLIRLRNKYNLKWTEYIDENGYQSRKNGVSGYPTYLLLNSSGVIIDNTATPDRIENLLKKNKEILFK